MTGEAEKPGESSDAEKIVRWIRFEKYLRYHAIYAAQQGCYWTYCGVPVQPATVRDEKIEPPAHCVCCRSRLKRPYLIPDRIARLRMRSE